MTTQAFPWLFRFIRGPFVVGLLLAITACSSDEPPTPVSHTNDTAAQQSVVVDAALSQAEGERRVALLKECVKRALTNGGISWNDQVQAIAVAPYFDQLRNDAERYAPEELATLQGNHSASGPSFDAATVYIGAIEMTKDNRDEAKRLIGERLSVYYSSLAVSSSCPVDEVLTKFIRP